MGMSDDTKGGLIAAGVNLLGTGINWASQGSMNRKTRIWSEAMYNQQRQEALADWNMVNEYNSPAEQMKRLKMAGLNPNLVYGNGATTEGGPVRSTSAQTWNPKAPQLDAQGALSAFYDAQVKTLTVDNLQKQGSVLLNEAALKAAQTASTLQGTEAGKFALERSRSLLASDLQAAELHNRKASAEIEGVLKGTELAILRNEREASTAVEQILKSRAERSKIGAEKQAIYQALENAKKDGKLKQLDIDLKNQGIQPHDALWQRKITEFLEKLSIDNPAGYIKNSEWYQKHKSDTLFNMKAFRDKWLPFYKK